MQSAPRWCEPERMKTECARTRRDDRVEVVIVAPLAAVYVYIYIWECLCQKASSMVFEHVRIGLDGRSELWNL